MAPPRGGAASSRGRGKFKVSRGGGRHFSRDLDTRAALKGEINGDESSEEEEEESEEESSDDEPTVAEVNAQLAPEMAALNLKLGNTVDLTAGDGDDGLSRAERKAAKKAQSGKKVQIKEPESDEDEEEDVGVAKRQQESKESAAKGRAAAQAKAKPAEMSRSEREAADKKAAAERYKQMHAAGKTTEAQTDLARLQEVRRRRDAAAKQREAEAAEAAKVAADKKEKAASRRF